MGKCPGRGEKLKNLHLGHPTPLEHGGTTGGFFYHTVFFLPHCVINQCAQPPFILFSIENKVPKQFQLSDDRSANNITVLCETNSYDMK